MPAPAVAYDRDKLRALKLDYEKWARTCYAIRDKAGAIHTLHLNGVQRAIGAWEQKLLAEKGRCRIYVLKGRQAGITTDQQARNLHQIWAHAGFDALTLTDITERTELTFEITRRAVTHFPDGLLPTLGEKATNQISFPTRDSNFFTGTAGSANTGRGLTLKRLHGSEFAHWKDPRETLSTVGPGLVPNGSVVVLETTASGYDSEGHNFWREAERGANGYLPLFFPWWECDPLLYRTRLDAPDELGYLEDDERDLVTRFGLDLEQIKWRRQGIAEYGRGKFLREYAEDTESCWMSVGDLFYDSEILKVLMTRAPAPITTDMQGLIERFAELGTGDRCIIGADTAEGGGGDRSTFTARGFAGWSLLSSYASASVEPESFAGVLDAEGRRHLDAEGMPALLVVEKNAHGITVLRTLRDKYDYPAERLYHRMSMGRDVSRPTRVVGWHTSGETQPLMLDAGRELFSAALNHRATPPYRAVIKDAFSVRRDSHGKISLTGRDALVSETLAWLGRSYQLRTSVTTPLSSTHTTVR